MRTYQAIAFTFLTFPKLLLLQQNPGRIASNLDLEVLSHSIIDAFSTRTRLESTQGDGLFFLLAHFISMNRAASGSQGSNYLKALDLQLAFAASEIRSRYNPEISVEDSSDEDDGAATKAARPLPPFVAGQLEFLVNEDGISELLKRFTS